MELKTYWPCGIAWEVYDLALSIKRVGDDAFRSGKWRTALSKYDDCQRLLEKACLHNPAIRRFNDGSYRETIREVEGCLDLNSVLVQVRRKQWAEVLEKTESAGSIPVTWNSLAETKMSTVHLRLHRAIALAAMHKIQDAYLPFAEVAAFDHADRLTCSSSDYFKFAIHAVNGLAADNLAAASHIVSDEALSKLSEPFELSHPIMTTTEHIQGERYMLRRFGYRGDLMLQQIKEENPIDVVALSELIERMEGRKGNFSPAELRPISAGRDLAEIEKMSRTCRGPHGPSEPYSFWIQRGKFCQPTQAKMHALTYNTVR